MRPAAPTGLQPDEPPIAALLECASTIAQNDAADAIVTARSVHG